MIQINNEHLEVFTRSNVDSRTTARLSEIGPNLAPSPSAQVQVSSKGAALSDIYEAANTFIVQEYMEPYPGEELGAEGQVLVKPNRYMNVEKYNNYIFDKAANSVVEQAKSQGVDLDKNDVLKTLKEENPSIAAIKFSNEVRLANLRPAQVSRNLTLSDLDDFADLYIAARENGLDADSVSSLAFNKSIRNDPTKTWGDEAEIFPIDWDFEKYGSSTPAFTPTASLLILSNDVREKLEQNGGSIPLGNEFLFDYLLHPRRGLIFADESWLQIISKAIDMKNSGQYLSSSV